MSGQKRKKTIISEEIDIMKCTRIEKNIIEFIRKWYKVLFFVVISLIGFLIRFYGRG